MAKKRTAGQLRHLLRDNTSDRDLTEICSAAVYARDWSTAKKAQDQMAQRSDWGVFDRRRFPVPDEVLTLMGQHELQRNQHDQSLEDAGFISQRQQLAAEAAEDRRPKRKPPTREATITIEDDDDSAAARRELARILGRR